ncbi:flavin-containing monooxygenase [Agitococcus lubricus]|uniref:Cation diffusion facilitator CzcD-associated flavoprotein CzcO n=1 Tax=Agitococcus lubricus TaxID=1077255 RepID=A0A2T5J3F3_9GAMM|nr:NAD(P)/FAD-dependent oxidoreductase [Agitococcus lubricus]PTQ91106.1 cation diffusion facilitator CzcD-associated flavoprotein CzcO [Agitococcus lubricus]
MTAKASIIENNFPIIIVGTGFSGIAMAVMLQRAGINSYTLLEKAEDIGGTWRDNTYPGAACDVPSHLYSFSFEPKTDWSRAFSPQQEIKSYLDHCVDKYQIREKIRFGCEVTGATFNESQGLWTVSFKEKGKTKKLLARAFILGNGALSTPADPDIKGLKNFKGDMFHSARWNHDVDLAGKKVAVVGTGASAIQIVPEIAKTVGQLTLFQRTAPWVLPKPDRYMTAVEKRLFALVPSSRWLHRAYIYWRNEAVATGFVVDPRLMKGLEFIGRLYLRHVVKDTVLREKLAPKFTIGCKRILMSNTYYQALTQANAHVITDGIDAITAKGIKTRDGVEHEVDAIVLATGFMVTNYLSRLTIKGLQGADLNTTMTEQREHYLGITVADFPNMFLMMGPNTGLGHNSMVFMIEAQARYIVQCIQAIRDKQLNYLDVRKNVQAEYSQDIQQRLQKSVWASGCQSWYLSADGHNGAAWPGFTWQYWLATRRLDLNAYHQVYAAVSDVEVVTA